MDSVVAVGTWKVNLSVHHLMGAARFSREVGKLEVRNQGEEFGEFWEEILQRSIASVFLSVAGLEAYINELFSEPQLIAPNADLSIVTKSWRKIEKSGLVRKFELALYLRSGQSLTSGIETLANLDRLIQMRNALTHFKPEWQNESKRHTEISDALSGVLRPNPFFPNEGLFPRAWATHTSTVWAVETILQFAREFEAQGGFKPNFDKFPESRFKP